MFFLRCICLNDAVVPKIPMLKDLEEGLQLYGLSQLIKQNSEVLEPVFTQSDKFNITADNFLEKLIVHYSQQQLYKSKEEDVFKFFADFVQALFYEGTSILLISFTQRLYRYLKQFHSIAETKKYF